MIRPVNAGPVLNNQGIRESKNQDAVASATIIFCSYIEQPEEQKIPTPDQSDTPEVSQTNLALDRTVLANERTYTAWVRTGLAALATGLGIAKFMGELMPDWSILVVASLLIFFSGVAFLLAAWRYSHLHIKVAKLEVDIVPLSMVIALSILFLVCSVIAIIFVWYVIV